MFVTNHRRVLNRVTSARIGFLKTRCLELGLPVLQAKEKAVLAYSAYRGLLQLAHYAPAVLPDDWPSYSEGVLRALCPAPKMKRKLR
jgi:hypothetical protein